MDGERITVHGAENSITGGNTRKEVQRRSPRKHSSSATPVVSQSNLSNKTRSTDTESCGDNSTSTASRKKLR